MKKRNQNKNNAHRKQRGFSVVEMLIAVLLAGIITSAAFSVYITQHKQWVVQDEIADMQASIRAAAQELTSTIRVTGQGIPENFPGGPINAYNTNPDTLVLAYDRLGLHGVFIEHDMPQPSSELRCDGHDISRLHDGDWMYIYDPITRTGEFFQSTQIQYSSSNIQHNTMPLSRRYPRGSVLLMLTKMKYYIDSTDPNHPAFMVQELWGTPQVYAENISGFNVQYKLSSGEIVDVPAIPTMVREVLITLQAHTNRSDPDFERAYRERSLVTRVKVRNLGMN